MATLTLHQWNSLEDAEQRRIVRGMARMIGTQDIDALSRVFNLCEPTIEKGIDGEQPVTRVAAPHLDPLLLLIKTYVR